MASNWLNKYLVMKPEVSKIFEDLESYHDWCRWELALFNESDLYKKNSPVYSAYLNSKKPKRSYNNQNKDYNRSGKKRNEQNISN